jgi:hypothetical protein
MSRERGALWGLWANGIGGALLLFFHFPSSFVVPSGDPPASTGDCAAGPAASVIECASFAKFWHWTNGIFSFLGFALIIVGIVLQSRVIAEKERK